ncbi:MAG TPA: hypothetical protein VGV61_16335 [Thermoanaerobaculia bacterium]|jgi:hypothetical protein|nr:hypothetical protein [Thermoanaerobaculia bacterium]
MSRGADRVAGCCPNWRQLAATRDAAPGDPPGWEEALRHLDGCAACRRAAVAADPTLAFRRLAPPSLADDEAEAMRLRVAALRGAGGVMPPARRPRARHLAAAASVALVLLTGTSVPRQSRPDAAASSVRSLPSPLPPALPAELAAEPLVELDKPYDHVVQWNGDDLSVVLVVDGRLGV